MECLRALSPAATAVGFHLAGGTAVALTIGHRRSVDFDSFTPRFPGGPVDLAESLARHGIALETTTLAEQTVHGLVAGVKVSFLEFMLAGLCYFDDADTEPMPTMLVPLDWDAVTHELREMVRSAARPDATG